VIRLAGQRSIDLWDGLMLPHCEQIRRAAYDRWLRRGRSHGHDREDWYAAEKEVRFLLNYTTIAEYALDSDDRLILGDGRGRRCRFCERTPHHVSFSAPRPVVPGRIGKGSLLTAEICDECQADCRDPLEPDLRRFWDALHAEAGATGEEPRPPGRACELFSAPAFKALIATALLILPESELPFFPDTLEWVSNPDSECDAGLFAATTGLVYSARAQGNRAWTSLSRRVDDDWAVPYLLYFLADAGVILQVCVPLSLRDEDLDGRRLGMPERSLAVGEGTDFREVPCARLPLVLPGSRPRWQDPRSSLGREEPARTG
jgi:hypothetical protein